MRGVRQWAQLMANEAMGGPWAAPSLPAAAWDSACLALAGFLLRLRTSPSIHGHKWSQGMRAHYLLNLQALLDLTPDGCEDRASRYRKLMEKL